MNNGMPGRYPMHERLPRILQLLPRFLAAALAIRILLIVFQPNPIAHIEVPMAPHWHPEEPVPLTRPKFPPATNSPKPAATSTNLATRNKSATNGFGTNLVKGATNLVGTNRPPGGTNTVETESALHPPDAPSIELPPGMPVGFPPGFPPGMGMPGGSRGPAPIPPLIQARIDKITQSELLAPVFHPPPMALLGIAGKDAFLRTPYGQMSLLREGGEADGLKLLRIGTNRVLVELAGEKKELIIFEGLGGESLLPK